MTILQAMADENLFAPWFRGDSWNAWKAFLAALFNLRMDDASVSVYRAHTGRLDAPPVAYRESYVIAGRRSGKSLIAALVATYLATFGDYRHILAPGEKAKYAPITSGDQLLSKFIRQTTFGQVTLEKAKASALSTS